MANLYDVLAAGFPADRSKPAFILSDGSAVSYAELEAGAAQLLVLVGLLAAEAIAVWVVTEEVARGLLDG